jgi:glycosyltransferase involved in cell wall biosynthesis
VRILHLTTSSQIGGAERLLILGARHGPARGDAHLVCTLEEPGPLHRAVREAGGTAYSLGLRHRREWALALPRLIWLLRHHPVDVVNTHLFHAGALAWLASRIAPFPRRVHTRHYGAYLHRYGGRWQILLDRQSTRAAHHVIAVSESVRRHLIEREGVPADRITRVYNGTEMVPSRRTPEKQDTWPVLVAVGALRRWKGHQHLVEALPRVRRRLPGTQLRIYGEGPEHDALRSLVTSLGLDTAVRLPGYVMDVFAPLAGADLMVQPSIEEGFGMAVLEGMSQECPVIATRVGGLPEVVEHGVTGLLVPPADPERLAAGIIALLDDADRRREMGAAGRLRLERQFTIATLLDRYTMVYERVLSPTKQESQIDERREDRIPDRRRRPGAVAGRHGRPLPPGDGALADP